VNKSLVLLVVALAAGAAGLAALSIPDSSERVAMLLRDGRDEAAVAVANAAFQKGSEGDLFLSTLFEINDRSGDVKTADVAIRKYLAEHGDDAQTLRRAADFFAKRYGSDARIDVLARLTELRHGPDDIVELARLYRLEGRYNEELALLDRFHDVGLPPAFLDRWQRLSARKQYVDQTQQLTLGPETVPAGSSLETRGIRQ
jgi:hypothetical protein